MYIFSSEKTFNLKCVQKIIIMLLESPLFTVLIFPLQGAFAGRNAVVGKEVFSFVYFSVMKLLIEKYFGNQNTNQLIKVLVPRECS